MQIKDVQKVRNYLRLCDADAKRNHYDAALLLILLNGSKHQYTY